MKYIDTDYLKIGFEEYGVPENPWVILLHGFPYDVYAFNDVGKLLASQNFHVIVPFLRGFGETVFLKPNTMRSGQQAALGFDLLSLMNVLKIQKAILAGYDWGGRAACIIAALYPERVTGLLTGGGYNIQNISEALIPENPDTEQRYWYQYYFHSERGKAGFEKYKNDFCNMLWHQWSPYWKFDKNVYDKTASSFNNPDFTEIVIHSYRHRFGLADGDPVFESIENKLINNPIINIPTIAIEGTGDGVTPLGSYNHLDYLFKNSFERRVVKKVGHNISQEAPREFAKSIIDISKEGI
jgi:pimeloyl-ACP methyl ester carboxylesterase